jgi:hypothetical protein
MALDKARKNLGVDVLQVELEMGKSKREWKSLLSGEWVRVERAVLDYFMKDGWKGYSKEGGLLLNLIKAMSFPTIEPRNRGTFIEALYAQNVAFDEDRYDLDWLLRNVEVATKEQIESNFLLMCSRKKYTRITDYGSSTDSSSMLDSFPGIKKRMFVDLYDALGNQKLLEIARIFGEDPYEYRKGWPDITMWKDGKVRFLEVKSPGDQVHKSQVTIIDKFMKPLGLEFSLVDVHPSVK